MLKNFENVLLLDYYGELLTQKQRSLIDMYYNHDLSLSEIAENEGITRQAVRDAVKHAEEQMREIESKLHFCQRAERFDKTLESILKIAESLPDGEQKQSIIELIYSQKEE